MQIIFGQVKRSIMSSPHSPNQNHLLAALPTAEFERLLPQLELVPMRLGDRLCESGDQLQHAYFPPSAIVSLSESRPATNKIKYVDS